MFSVQFHYRASVDQYSASVEQSVVYHCHPNITRPQAMETVRWTTESVFDSYDIFETTYGEVSLSRYNQRADLNQLQDRFIS